MTTRNCRPHQPRIQHIITAIFAATIAVIIIPTGAFTAHAASTATASTNTAMTVELDARTGAVVRSYRTPAISPMISIHAICNATDACWVSGAVPYADEGFYGSKGTKTGTWPDRSEYKTGKYTVSACWSFDGTNACSARNFPPNFTVTFDDYLVTGTSLTIH